MRKKWKYGILGYVFVIIGCIIGLYFSVRILDISNELFLASCGNGVSPDDLFRYSHELEWIYLFGTFALSVIAAAVITFFIGALLEEEPIGDRKGEVKIEPYYYEVLGISKEASLEAIRNAYREAVLQFHPEVNLKQDATKKFAMIKKAYETLSNPDKRAEYDRRNRG